MIQIVKNYSTPLKHYNAVLLFTVSRMGRPPAIIHEMVDVSFSKTLFYQFISCHTNSVSRLWGPLLRKTHMSIGKKWSISLQRSSILMFLLLQVVECFRRREYRVKRYFLYWMAIFCFITDFSYNEFHESSLSYCEMSDFFALQTGHMNSLCISIKVYLMSGVWITSLDELRLVH